MDWKPLCLILLLCAALQPEMAEGKGRFGRLIKRLRISVRIKSYPSVSPYKCDNGGVLYKDRCFKMMEKKLSFEKGLTEIKNGGVSIPKFRTVADATALLRLASSLNVKYLYVGIKFTSTRYERFYRQIFSIKFKKGKCLVLRIKRRKLRYDVKSCGKKLPLMVEYRGCKKNQFRCANGMQCIKPSLKCNGIKECDDGSDEELPECTKCGGKISKDTGTITSPNYPNNYDAKLTCKWVINVANADYIKITFSEFNTEFSFDKLFIYYGNWMRRISGRFTTPPQERMYEVDQLVIIFKSDHLVQKKGFRLTFAKGDYSQQKQEVSTVFKQEFTAGEFKEYYSKYWVYQSAASFTGDGMTVTIRNFLFDPACTITFYSDVDRTTEIASYSGAGSSRSYVVFSAKRIVVVSLSCGTGFTIRSSSFRLDYSVYAGFEATLSSTEYGSLVSPPTGIKIVKCPYSISGLDSNYRFVASMFDLIEEEIEFGGKNYSDGGLFITALNKFMVTFTKGGKVEFDFRRKYKEFNGNGFQLSYSLNCKSPSNEVVEFDGNEKELTAPEGYVFDNSDLGVTKKKFTCVVGGVLSPAYVVRKRKCNIAYQENHGFSTFEVEMLRRVRDRDLGDTAKYYCPHGYQGTYSFKCTKEGWERTSIACVRAACKQGKMDSNLRTRIYWSIGGSVEDGKSYNWGTFVRFYCASGNEVQGSRWKICNPTGQWSHKDPTCKEIKCSILTQFKNLYQDPNKDYKLNELAVLQCPKGKRLKKAGEVMTIQCIASNTWSSRDFWSFLSDDCVSNGCQDKPCGNHACKEYRHGYVCICNDGYQLNPKTRKCEDINECKDNWKWRLWNCHKCHNTDGSYHCTCKDGYQVYKGEALVGIGTIKSTFKNKTCVPMACPAVELKQTRSKLIDAGRLFGVSNRIQCKTGYHAEDMKTYYDLSCKWDDDKVKWNTEQQCKIGECPKKQSVHKGSLKIDDHKYGSKAEVVCDDGYKLKKSSENKYECVMQHSHGKRVMFVWNGAARCIKEPNAKSCPELEHPDNGKVIASTDVGAIAYYSCKNGFVPSAIPFRTCKPDGKWSGTAVSCDLMTCPKVDITGRGVKAARDGADILFNCSNSDGYTMNGDRKITCSRKDVWEAQTNLTMKSIYACDGSFNYIGCPSGRVIHPVYALYGFDSQAPKGCELKDTYYNETSPCGDPHTSLSFVNGECKGRHACWVVAAPQNFKTTRKTVCNGKTPMLEVTYLCVPPNTKVSSSHALLACNALSQGLVGSFLNPKLSTEKVVETIKDNSNLCESEFQKKLDGCTYSKARVIDSSIDMLEYLAMKQIYMDACANHTRATSCAKCLDMFKKESSTAGMPRDVCAQSVKGCFKTCWKDGPMQKLFETFTTQFCAASQYITQDPEKNLLANLKLFLTTTPDTPRMSYHIKKKSNPNWVSWGTTYSPEDITKRKVNLGFKPLKFPGKEIKIRTEYRTRIEVTGFYVLLDGNARFTDKVSLVAIGPKGMITYKVSDSRSEYKLTITRVRGDVIKVVPQVGSIPGYIFDVILEFETSDESESSIMMSMSYKPRPIPKIIKCYKCTDQASSDECNEIQECGDDTFSCYSTWSIKNGKPLVSKGCETKADVMKLVDANECSAKDGKKCSSQCGSDYCNGYGQCPVWAPNCIPALSSDTFNLTLRTKTEDTSQLQSCALDIKNFMSIESGKMLAAFKAGACKYVHLSFDHRIRVASNEISMVTTIRRKYMSHYAAACLYHENQKHTPFKAVKEVWERMKDAAVCFGRVGFSLESQIHHRCALGMHFSAPDGWCIPKDMIMPADNILTKSSTFEDMEIRMDTEKFRLDTYGRFKVTSGGNFEFKIKFKNMVIVKRMLVSVVGSGYSVSMQRGGTKMKQLSLVRSSFGESFSSKFYINGDSEKGAYIFLGLDAFVNTYPVVKCFSCKNATSEEDCTEMVACAKGYQACYTEWNKVNNRTLISKGCRTVFGRSKASLMMNSSCHNQSLQTKDNSTHPCTSYSLVSNGHGICPVWATSCKPGLNSVQFKFAIENKIEVTNDSNCYNSTVEAVDKWVAAQIKKGAKSIFGDFGYYVFKQSNMTTYKIEEKRSEKKIVFHVSVTMTYYSYNLARLRLPLPKHDGADEKLSDVKGCPKNEIRLEDRKVYVRCAFNRTQDSKMKLCHGEEDLDSKKNLAVNDGFQLEVKNATGANVVKVTADHFKVSEAMTYVVKAQFGSTKTVRSLTVHYFGQCHFLSLTKRNISEECLKEAKGNRSKAIDCVINQAKRTISFEIQQRISEYSFNFTLQNPMMKCEDTKPAHVAIRVAYSDDTILTCVKCKKNDICEPENCKDDEICYAHVKRSNSGWTHQKAECKNKKSCTDSPYKCDKNIANCHICCSTKNCNTIKNVAEVLKSVAVQTRKRRAVAAPSLKLSREGTFISSTMVETKVDTYPLSLFDAFVTQFSGTANFVWIGTTPECKDTTPPKTLNTSMCSSVVYFDEAATEPARRGISVSTITPQFSDNSKEKVKVEILNNDTNFDTILNVTNWSTFVLRTKATDSAKNDFHCNVTIQWRDVTPPKVTCPRENYVQETRSTQEKVAIQLPVIPATDINGIDQVVYSIDNGTAISQGVQQAVKVKINDTRGNDVWCNYTHSIRSTKCSRYSFQITSREHLEDITVKNAGSFEQINLKCSPGYSLGSLFETQKIILCANGNVTISTTFKGSSIVPPCLLMSGVHSLSYDVTLSGICCSSGLKDDVMRTILKDKVSCLKKFSAHLTFRSGTSAKDNCKRHLNVSYVYDNSYSSLNDLKSCGTEIDQAIAENLPKLTVGACGVSESNTTGKFSSEMSCPSGYVSNKKPATAVKLCVPCYKGSFYNETDDTCVACDYNTYQDENGQLTCKKCPEEHGTLFTGSISKSACLERCAAGFYRRDERPYGVCLRCRKGTFSTPGSKQCKACPTGMSTAGEAASLCLDLCPKGQYSSTGVVPCKRCPRHTYQSKTGETSCVDCPANQGTRHKGSDNSSYCSQLKPCDPNPCKHNGTCEKRGRFDFTCNCAKGYTGELCNKEINICEISDPCVNGDCKQDGVGYNCSCKAGWLGKDCDEQDYCHESPCQHGSNCTLDAAKKYECKNCPSDYEGKNCHILKSPCGKNPCKNSGNCTVDGKSFLCECAAGFEGATCEKEVDPCGSSPCSNGGTCTKKGKTAFSCDCTVYWNGTTCDENIDECQNSPCQNNGTCTDQPGDYDCACKDGYEGRNCSTNIDDCANHRCQNNATCEDGVNSFKCVCKEGFEGKLCDQVVEKCPTCDKDGGACVQEDGKFICKCKPNFKGSACSEAVDYCTPNPCNGNVKCIQGADLVVGGESSSTDPVDFRCDCPKYRGGQKCEIQLDTCIGNACANGATCKNGTTDYTCDCSLGYNGTLCDNTIDLCTSLTPCANGGECTSTPGGYTCACNGGWNGTNCTEDLDECLATPCKNNGKCNNLPNAFSCDCGDGFSGDDCSVVLPICDQKPCKNNGSCYAVKDSTTNYTCECITGFDGSNCEVNIDDCGNSTCKNNATCIDGINSYTCKCPPIYYGDLCDKVRSENFDMLFDNNNVSGSYHSKFQFSFGESTEEFTVGYWVRSTSTNLDVSHFELVENLQDGSNVTWVNVTGNTINAVIGSKKLQASITTSSKKWSYVVITYKNSTKQLSVSIDGSGVTNSMLDHLSPKKRNLTAVLGSREAAFHGLISRVYIRDKALTAATITDNAKKCKISPETTSSSDIIMDWRVMATGHPRAVPSVCGETTCPAGKTGASCDQTIDTAKPTIVYCPNEVSIVNSSNLVELNFREPEFSDAVGVTRVEKSHKPGQALPPGSYTVTYTAYDAAGNSQDCSFELTIVPFKCEVQAAPDNFTVTVCSAGTANDVYCQVSCKDPARYVIPDEGYSMYSCSPASKGWQPIVGESFSIVGCVESVKPAQAAEGQIAVTVTSQADCKSREKAIKDNFVNSMKALKALGKNVCNQADCEDIRGKLNLNCGGARRRRRQTTATLSYSLPGGSASSSAMCTNIRSGSSPFNSGGLQASGCPSTNPSCTPGYVLNEDRTSCIACNPGYYHKNAFDTTCTACPKGTYTAVQKTVNSCTACPNNQTTPGVGAVASDLCYTVCPAGQFMDTTTTTGSCKPCPVGSSTPTAGQAQCISCPPGHTAPSGSAECKKCGAGHQVAASGLCIPCDKGQYRPDNDAQPSCQDCPTAFTTASTGATALSQCDIPICNPGQYETNKVCKPCQQGTYQSMKGQNLCHRCPKGHTSKEGATSSSDCKVGLVNECAIGSATCHKHAKCIDTPDFFTCECNAPNWTGNGFNCYCAKYYSGKECEVEEARPLSNEAIIGIAVGCTLAAIIIVSIIITCYLKKTTGISNKKGGLYEINYNYNTAGQDNRVYEMS